MTTNFTAQCADCEWHAEENDAFTARKRASNHEWHNGHDVSVEET